MARISELHYSNAYAASSGVSEFLEIALNPNENPADFVASFYEANGTEGFRLRLNDPGITVSTGAGGELVYVISADVYPIQLTDPNGNTAGNYEAFALTNTTTNTVFDFYDIGGGTRNITATNGAASGATSENIAVPFGPNATTTTIQFNQPNPGTAVYESVDPGATGVICFVAGAQIITPDGLKPVESLKVGDLVITRDNGFKPVGWIGQRTVPGKGDLAPIRLAKGFLGAQRPHYVSPNHRILVSGAFAEMLFGESEILVPAKALVVNDRVSQCPCESVTYVHIMFDQHEIVTVDGVESESFYPGKSGMDTLEDATREELISLFPELESQDAAPWYTARMVTTAREGAAVAAYL